MRAFIWPAFAIAATAYGAAISSPLSGDLLTSRASNNIVHHLNSLGSKLGMGTLMLVSGNMECDATSMEETMPLDLPSSLPPVSPGLVLKNVAIGRGTQNYTCDTANTTAAPLAIGAKATLFDATCVAAVLPDLLGILPRVLLEFELLGDASSMSEMEPGLSGRHFFLNRTTPFFDLDTPAMQLGKASCVLNSSVAAPRDAFSQGIGDTAAVPWLKLVTRNDTIGDIREVYRLHTAGGQPPQNCSGKPAAFEVQYAAQYWFYASKSTSA